MGAANKGARHRAEEGELKIIPHNGTLETEIPNRLQAFSLYTLTRLTVNITLKNAKTKNKFILNRLSLFSLKIRGNKKTIYNNRERS